MANEVALLLALAALTVILMACHNLCAIQCYK